MLTAFLSCIRASACTAVIAACLSSAAYSADLRLDVSTPSIKMAEARQEKTKTEAAARQLLSQGEADAALALLLPLENLYAGDEHYDYLLGTAAFDSGDHGLAILSLQRVMRTNPNFAGARLELARAYHAHGNVELAQREFEQLLALNPPAPVKALISRYLIAQVPQQKRPEPSLSLSIAAISGYDSNANAGIDGNNVFSPLVSDESLETESGFLGASIGGRASLPISSRNRLHIAASGDVIDYSEASFVNRDRYGAAISLEHQRQKLRLDTHLRYNRHSVGNDIDFDHKVLGVSAAAEPADGWLLQLTLDAAELRFSKPLNFRDVNQRTSALSLHRFWGKRAQSTGVSIIAGEDHAKNTEDVDWSRQLRGLQLSHVIKISPRWNLTAKLAGLSSQYNDNFFTDGDNRRDITRSAIVEVNRNKLLCEQCELNLAVQYRSQSSNIDLYRYDGVDVTLRLERKF